MGGFSSPKADPIAGALSVSWGFAITGVLVPQCDQGFDVRIPNTPGDSIYVRKFIFGP